MAAESDDCWVAPLVLLTAGDSAAKMVAHSVALWDDRRAGSTAAPLAVQMALRKAGCLVAHWAAHWAG